MTVIGRLLERRAFTPHPHGVFGDRSIPSNANVGFVHSGEPVSDHTALNLVAFFACVRTLADIVASLPWDTFRKQAGTSVEVPSPELLENPYRGETGDLTAFDWKHQTMVSLAMRGNFYGYVVSRDRMEFPRQVEPLHPDWVSRQRERVGNTPGPVVTRIGGEEVPNADVVHLRGFTLPGEITGLSPINAARHSIGLGLAAQRFGAMWFRDGAAPSGQLTTDQDMTPEKAREQQQMWIETHGGRRLPAVLTGGLKYEPISISPEDSQFLGTREFSTREMAMLVGLPPHMIGDVERSTSWGTGIEQQSIGFVTYNLSSWLRRIEEGMSRLRPRGEFVRFNVDGLLRGDIKARYDAYRIAIEAGFKNPDEVREKEDLPPIPGGAGTMFRQPLNFGPLGSDPDERKMAEALEIVAAGLRRKAEADDAS